MTRRPTGWRKGAGGAGATAVLALSLAARAQTLGVLPDEPEPDARFGHAVALSGGTMVVGAYASRDGDRVGAGSAYVFTQGVDLAWSEAARLVAGTPPVEHAAFGSAVAIDANRILVGARMEDRPARRTGAAYVFDRNGTNWVLSTRLSPGPGATGANAEFGAAVALSGALAAIGAPFDRTGTNLPTGAVYVYAATGDTWQAVARLTAPAAAAWDAFGQSVAMDADALLVGMPRRDTAGGPNAGAACLYRRAGTNVVLEATLEAPGGRAGDLFGCSVAVAGDVAAVGAIGDDAGGPRCGAVHMFRRDAGGAWGHAARLLPGHAAPGSAFGWSVAAHGGRIAAGAPREGAGGAFPGAAYLFQPEGDTWTVGLALRVDAPGRSATLGESVALSEAWMAAGAPGTETGTNHWHTGVVRLAPVP